MKYMPQYCYRIYAKIRKIIYWKKKSILEYRKKD